jgi:hypothetical protein
MIPVRVGGKKICGVVSGCVRVEINGGLSFEAVAHKY